MIYFIQYGTNGPIKIGYTDNDVQTRLNQLQTGCPYELKLLWVYTDNFYTESQIHEMFSHERIRGEWFYPCEQLISFIETELGNHFEVKTNNGRDLTIIESYDGNDEINISTAKCYQATGRQKYTTLFHKFNKNEIYINPADKATVVMVNGWVCNEE